MAFIDGRTKIVDLILTQKGREQLSKGKLIIKYYAFGDDEIDYQAQYINRPAAITPSGAPALLMEDGVSYILMENGSKILLEG